MTTNQQETAAVSHINDLSLASEFLMCAIRALAAGDATDDESVSGPPDVGAVQNQDGSRYVPCRK